MPYRRDRNTLCWELVAFEEEALQERGHHVCHTVGIEENALQERETYSV